MKFRQQITLSEAADNYLRQFGSLSYVATRLLYELKDSVIGLPNLRIENRSSCKRNNIIINISEQLYVDFVTQLQNQADAIQASPSYVYFSFSRLLEWAAATDYPLQHHWPILCDRPMLEFATAAIYTLEKRDVVLLQTELNKLKEIL